MHIYCNAYLQQLKEISHQNEFLDQYIAICETAALRSSNKKEARKLFGYTEGHHALPKSFKLGGEKDPLNKVHLLPREHFEVHQLLPKFLINKKHLFQMTKAFQGMCNSKRRNFYNITADEYEFLKKLQAEKAPEFRSVWLKNDNTLEEKLVEPDEIETYKINGWVPGRIISQATRDKVSKASNGIPKSAQGRKNITEANKRRKGTKNKRHVELYPSGDKHKNSIKIWVKNMTLNQSEYVDPSYLTIDAISNGWERGRLFVGRKKEKS